MKPFTLEEANDIVEDFEDVIGTAFGNSFDAPDITYVIAAPFDSSLHIPFIEAYHNKTHYNYSEEGEYDVLVIAMAEEGVEIYQNIREYVKAHGINYHFPA
jgi:hypothetical protein